MICNVYINDMQCMAMALLEYRSGPEPDVSPGIHQDTFWSEVSVEEPTVVEILQSQDHLPGVELNNSLGQSRSPGHGQAPDSEQIENEKSLYKIPKICPILLQLINLMVTALSLPPVKCQSEPELAK